MYKALGNYSQAEPLLKRALVIREKQLGAEHPSIATSLNNLALLYQSMSKYSQAESLLKRALVIHEKQLGTDHPSTATNLDNLAVLYNSIGKYSQAKPLYKRALAIREKQLGTDHPATAISLNNLAALYDSMGKYSQAQPLSKRALAICEKQLGTNHPSTTTSLGNYAWLLKNQNNPKAATFFLKHSINTLQSSRQKNLKLSKELKSSFISNNESTYRTLVTDLLNQNRLQEAEHVMAMYKEKEVADYYKKDRTVKNDRPATLIDFNTEEQTWNKHYQKITHALYTDYQAYKKLNEKKTLSKKEQQQIKQLEKTVASNTADFNQFLHAISQPWAKNTTKPASSTSPDELQKTLAKLGKGIVIVNYFVEDNKLRILLTTPTTRILRDSTLSAKALGQHIKNYRSKLEQRGGLRRLSKILHQHLIAPIKQDLQKADAQTLMLSLDATLRYLPMAALHNGDSYLIERYKLSVYTPAVGYQALTAMTNTQPRAIAMGITKAATLPPLLAGGESYSFSALPYVANEVNGIVRNKDANNATGLIKGNIYLNEKAKKEVLIKALSEKDNKRFAIIHLATHFQLNKGNGYQSFLLLGEQTTLPIAELYRHPTVNFKAVDLLTVSACNTGMLNAQSDGSEVESFAAIAQQKGAKAVLASLWAVNDRSTSQLMQTFYRHWKQDTSESSGKLEKPVSKLVALQKAQLSFIQQGKNAEKSACSAIQLPGIPSCADRVVYPKQSHPYYWAPFTLMGNWL